MVGVGVALLLLAVVAGVGLVVVGHEAEAPSHSALEHHGGGDVRHETLEALGARGGFSLVWEFSTKMKWSEAA